MLIIVVPYFFLAVPRGMQNLSSPDQGSGIEPVPHAGEVGSFNHWTAREVPITVAKLTDFYKKWSPQSGIFKTNNLSLWRLTGEKSDSLLYTAVQRTLWLNSIFSRLHTYFPNRFYLSINVKVYWISYYIKKVSTLISL